jgi:hypothetical protein
MAIIKLSIYNENNILFNQIIPRLNILEQVNNQKNYLGNNFKNKYIGLNIEKLNNIDQDQKTLEYVNDKLKENIYKLKVDEFEIINILHNENNILISDLLEIINKSSIQEILSYYMEIDKDKILNTINIYNGLNMVISIEQLNEYNNIFKNFMKSILVEHKTVKEMMTDIIEMRKEELVNIHGEDEGNRLHNEEI